LRIVVNNCLTGSVKMCEADVSQAINNGKLKSKLYFTEERQKCLIVSYLTGNAKGPLSLF